ncbi:MAG: type II secretion system protein GspM, partial [Methylococcaceae bacterium]
AIENQRQLNATLKTISAEVSVLQQNQIEAPEPKGSQSQMSIIDASSEQLGIKTAIKRIVPEGQDTVTLWLEKCEFDKLIYWLAVLDKKHAITVRQINIRQEQGNNGLVSGKIIVGD